MAEPIKPPDEMRAALDEALKLINAFLAAP
jgi:hypothetical protein